MAMGIRRQHLTYLSPEKLRVMERQLRRVLAEEVPGDFAEFGIALGGSAILIAKNLDGQRRFLGYDVFGQIPAPGEEDDGDAWSRYRTIAAGQSHGIGGETYYGYRPNLYDEVVRSFERFGVPVDGRRVALKKGLFADTVKFAPEDRVAFAHIDCDWYDPVRFCLESVAPHCAPGAAILLDDYNDYGGCRKATDAFLRSNAEFELVDDAPNAVVMRR